MQKLILIVFLFTSSCNAFAVTESIVESGGWVDRNGNPVPDSDKLKSNKGFGGWVIVTPDQDWEEKWNTPTEHTPHFNEAVDVNYGDSLTVLTFIINPAVDANGEVNVICDIQILRPDNSVSIDLKETDCLTGQLQGNPRNIRLTVPVIKFIGEQDDPPGDWLVNINLNDKNRGALIRLKTGFKLVQ